MVPARSTAALRGQPHVDERRDHRHRARSPRPPAARTAGRRPARDPGRSCAGRRRSASGLGDAASAALAQTSHAIDGRRDRAATAPRGETLVMTPPRSRPRCQPMTTRPRPAARQAAATSGRRGSPSVRSRIASSGSSVVSTSGRPSPADSRGCPASSRPGTPSDDRVLDRRDLLDPEPDRGIGRRAGRDAVGDVGGGADRFARHDHEPGVERRVVDDDPLEAVADLERDALPAVLEGDPAGRRDAAGAGSGGRRAAGARRPRTRPRRRSGR